MDILVLMAFKACGGGLFSGVMLRCDGSLLMPILQYVDDMTFFIEGGSREAQHVGFLG
jgi:hypothetical protein